MRSGTGRCSFWLACSPLLAYFGLFFLFVAALSIHSFHRPVIFAGSSDIWASRDTAARNFATRAIRVIRGSAERAPSADLFHTTK